MIALPDTRVARLADSDFRSHWKDSPATEFATEADQCLHAVNVMAELAQCFLELLADRPREMRRPERTIDALSHVRRARRELASVPALEPKATTRKEQS